jgi:hypothetical protein
MGGRHTQNFVPKPRFEKQTKNKIFCSSCFPRSRVVLYHMGNFRHVFTTTDQPPPHIGAKRELFALSKLSDFVSQVHVRGSALVKGGDPLGHDIIASAPLSLAGWRGERRAFVKNPGKPRRKRSGMILGNLREPQRRRGLGVLNCNGEKPWGENIARKFGCANLRCARASKSTSTHAMMVIFFAGDESGEMPEMESYLSAKQARRCRRHFWLISACMPVGDIAREQTSMIAKHPGSSEHRSLPTPPLFLKRNDDVAKSETCLDMRDQIFRSGGRGSVCEVCTNVTW